MAGVFEVQGFGFQFDYNGELVTGAARDAMRDIAATHANAISIVPRIFTQTATSNEVLSDPAKTESMANLAQSIADAHALGLSVLLKPLLTPLDGAGQMSLAPTDVAAFFASYLRRSSRMQGSPRRRDHPGRRQLNRDPAREPGAVRR
jgi:hypothetical protein